MSKTYHKHDDDGREPLPPPPVILAVTEATGAEPRGAARDVWTDWAMGKSPDRVKAAIDRAERTVREQGHGRLTVSLVKALDGARPNTAPMRADGTPARYNCPYCGGRGMWQVGITPETNGERVDVRDGHGDGWRYVLAPEPAWPLYPELVWCSCSPGAKRQHKKLGAIMARGDALTPAGYHALQQECARLAELQAANGGRVPRQPPPGNIAAVAPTSSRNMMHLAGVALATPPRTERDPASDRDPYSDEDAPL